MNLTDQFLDRIEQVRSKPFPPEVLKKAKRSLQDYLCVTLAGARAQQEKLSAYWAFAEPEHGRFTAIGSKHQVTLKEAVFLNGLNGHALDYDDGTNAGIIHLGSPLFSVLLPLAEKYGCTYEKLMESVILGYETSFTMALSIQPMHKAMGYHATGTCGTLGIAVAISYLLDFTPQERKEAFAAACVSAMGMLKVLDDGSELKPYNVAKTAMMGLITAQMAKAGYHGHPDPLAGERGFLKMMTGKEDIELRHPLWNGSYAIEKTYTKPYAACRYLHPAIEAAISLKNSYGLTSKEIERIHIRTYFWAVNKHDHCEIHGAASAKMSIPYSVAAGIVYGKAGLQEYEAEAISNREVLELARKITVTDDAVLTAQFPELTTAIVQMDTIDGRSYEYRVDHPKGEPENPLTDAQFHERFVELAVYGGKTSEEAEAIFAFVQQGESDWIKLSALLK